MSPIQTNGFVYSRVAEPHEISRRLDDYFGTDLGLDPGTPVWRLVDRIKQLRPGWPDEPDPS